MNVFKLRILCALFTGSRYKNRIMFVANSYKTTSRLFFATAVAMLFVIHPLLSQSLSKKTTDSASVPVNDSLLSGVVMKVASYTATIDHTDFLIRRKFNFAPISIDLPEIERKVKGFKTRLEKRGNQMNLRSLNSGVIMLNEISSKLAAYQNVLTTYSTELTQSNSEVKKILQDPVLYVQVSDSILMEQLLHVRMDGHALDSLQQKTITRVNLMRNKVSVNLLQATDIISDMRYLTISLKMGMWNQEETPLFQSKQDEYKSTLSETTNTALQRSWLIITIYIKEKLNVLTLGALLFVCSFFWSLLNMQRIKKQENVAAILEPLHFLNRSILVACLMTFFTYLPFLFANPPMSFLHACELLRLAMLMYLIYPYLTQQSKVLWFLLTILWIYYALDDVLLESSFGERWGLFLGGLLLAAICIKLISNRKPNYIKLTESPVTKALVVFTLAQVVLSVIFNMAGRISLAKIFGVSAIQSLVLGISLKVVCTMVLEAIYLQAEAFQESRFAEFLNFRKLQHRFLRVLWTLSVIIWTVSLIRNLTLYDVMLRVLGSFFYTTRTIGSMVFTFESVAIFICILWLSSVISGIINFFFGHQKVTTATNRSRLGSMMLLIRLTIWTLGFFIAVAAAGIPLDKLSLMLGALGVGIGFGLQNIVNNLVSGVILAFERPIQIGDLIEVGGKLGVVKEIGVRSSKINNNKGADIIVPNGDLLSQHLINWTMQDRNKEVEFTISIPFQVDLEKVKKLVQETLFRNEKVIKSRTPSVLVQQFGDSTIDLLISFWVHDLAEANAVRSSAMFEIYKVLIGAGSQSQVYKITNAEPVTG